MLADRETKDIICSGEVEAVAIIKLVNRRGKRWEPGSVHSDIVRNGNGLGQFKFLEHVGLENCS